MFLARDRLGVKPLYYALLADGMFVFGSELKSLLAHPELSRELDPRAVEDYFASATCRSRARSSRACTSCRRATR